MVHGLAELSGGQLVLTSEKGRGTTAELWLPRAKKTDEAIETKPPVKAPVKERRRLVVLVVDDDPLVLLNTTAMLDDAGHQVFEAGSAREALTILRRERGVQLVITDQGMPQMTGLQLTEKINHSWPDLPVILATGYAELPSGSHPQLVTLAKPFREFELLRAVETAMTAPDAPRVVGFRTSAQ
jgi:CheY-like chemotaxis protein